MEIERTGGLRIHADTGQIARQQMPSRDQRHYRELNHLAGARQHTGKRVDDVPMTAADMAGVSIAMSSSAPPLLSIPVARTTPVGSADSPRQRVRLLCGVPYGAGQFGDLAWGHG